MRRLRRRVRRPREAALPKQPRSPVPPVGRTRARPLRRQAAIGRVFEDDQRFVQMTTGFGGRRIVDWLSGEQPPDLLRPHWTAP